MNRETVYAMVVIVVTLAMLSLAGHEDYQRQLDQDRNWLAEVLDTVQR
jgi:hypothetical protein